METQTIPIGLWDDSCNNGSLAHAISSRNEEANSEDEDRGPPIALLRYFQVAEDDGSAKYLAQNLYHGDNLVGRSSKCDVVVDDCTVSDIHAELIIGTDSEVSVKDLKSR
jgi:hypothetical protein